MAQVSVTVYREKEKHGRGRNVTAIAGEAQSIATERIIRAVPSVCKMDGVQNVNTGRVNSKVLLDQGKNFNPLFLWVSQTVAEVAALDD